MRTFGSSGAGGGGGCERTLCTSLVTGLLADTKREYVRMQMTIGLVLQIYLDNEVTRVYLN